jgi:hypothetical protein
MLWQLGFRLGLCAGFLGVFAEGLPSVGCAASQCSLRRGGFGALCAFKQRCCLSRVARRHLSEGLCAGC